jgi:hypothetical protein
MAVPLAGAKLKQLVAPSLQAAVAGKAGNRLQERVGRAHALIPI